MDGGELSVFTTTVSHSSAQSRRIFGSINLVKAQDSRFQHFDVLSAFRNLDRDKTLRTKFSL